MRGFRKWSADLTKNTKFPQATIFFKVALPFAAKTYLWSSGTAEPYLCMTIHYTDSECEIKSKCLQTLFFPKRPHSRICCNGPQRSDFCITTDYNADNMIKASLNSWMRQHSFGHRLHLAIGELCYFSPDIAQFIIYFASFIKCALSHFSDIAPTSRAVQNIQHIYSTSNC